MRTCRPALLMRVCVSKLAVISQRRMTMPLLTAFDAMMLTLIAGALIWCRSLDKLNTELREELRAERHEEELGQLHGPTREAAEQR